MTVKKGQIIDLYISDMAFGGKGIARVDGLTVFVGQTAPRDRVTAQIIKKKKKSIVVEKPVKNIKNLTLKELVYELYKNQQKILKILSKRDWF